MLHTAKKYQVTAPVSKAVVNIADFRNRDVVSLCELLLQKAKSGEITGMIYTVRLDDVDQEVSAIGCYAKDASIGLPAMLNMSEILRDYIGSKI